jgi:hypothetical protein
MRKFLARRGIPTSVTNTITRRLQAIDGKTTQGLIKQFQVIDDGVEFTYEDYVAVEFSRIRSLERERGR